MRQRLVLAALVPVVVALGGIGTAHAAPYSGAPANAHGQCVSESPHAAGKGGRSATATSKGSCTPPLRCEEKEGGDNTVVRNSAANAVTITGTNGLGSSLECQTDISVVAGQKVTVSSTVSGGAVCGAGSPRLFVGFEDAALTDENTFDGNPGQCGENGTVTYTVKATGTVNEVYFVYDNSAGGTVTFSNAKVGDLTLYI